MLIDGVGYRDVTLPPTFGKFEHMYSQKLHEVHFGYAGRGPGLRRR